MPLTEQEYDQLLELSDEDFAKLGQQHAASLEQPTETPAEPPAEPPRDEKGRFAPAKTEPEEQVVYRREVDLGDGAGVQVFEAASQEDLIEVLVEAQRNATKKIRELAAETEVERCQTCGKKPKKCKCGQPTPLTDDEKFVLAQRMQQDPEAFFQAMLQREMNRKGSVLQQMAEKANRASQTLDENTVAAQFLEKRGFTALDPQDGKRIEKYFATYRMPVTLKNLETVYDELSASGLLKGPVASEEIDVTEAAEEPPKAQARIAPRPAVRTVVVQKKATSGLSVRKAPAQTAPVLTEDDLYNMPMDKFLALGGMSKDGW